MLSLTQCPETPRSLLGSRSVSVSNWFRSCQLIPSPVPFFLANVGDTRYIMTFPLFPRTINLTFPAFPTARTRKHSKLPPPLMMKGYLLVTTSLGAFCESPGKPWDGQPCEFQKSTCGNATEDCHGRYVLQETLSDVQYS